MSSPKIFISYSSRDGQDYGEFVSENYRDSGYEVFWSDKDVFPGDYYERKIFNYVSNCNFFILIGTRRALNSSWVEKEFLEAKKLGKWIIVCIHKNIPTNDIGKSVVGRNIVNQIDYEKFESGPSILRIVDPLLEQQVPSTKSPSPVPNKTPVTKNIVHKIRVPGIFSELQPPAPPPAIHVEKSLTEIWNEVISKKDFILTDYIYAIPSSVDSDLTYMIALVSLWERKGDWKRAIKEYKRGLTNDPRNPQLLVNKGWVLRNMGKHSEAMDCFEEAKAFGKSVMAFLPDGRPVYER